MLTLSSTLVALGSAGTDSSTFLPLACVALPVLAVVGRFTEVRLVGPSLTNVAAQRRVTRIRSFYATVDPDAGAFFPAAEPVSTVLDVADGWRASLSTMATMVAIVISAAVGVGGGVPLPPGRRRTLPRHRGRDAPRPRPPRGVPGAPATAFRRRGIGVGRGPPTSAGGDGGPTPFDEAV
jgi:hypothetical protein